MEIKLMHNPLSREYFINAISECLDSGEYTQGAVVDKFEKEFAKWNGSNYAVMCNSGSSANLLIMALLKEKYGLNDGDEVLVPAVTWPTTIYPVIQNNLVPVICDVDDGFNISVESMKKMTSSRTKALFLVHLLGQPANLDKIIPFCKEKNIIIVEDCCESLGALYNGKKVGNFGAMGSFSFYFGHHMTTIEGGMIVTDDFETYDLLKSIRSHGWVRNSARKKMYASEYKHLDFVFDHLGYNVRSTNINAAIGLKQLETVDNSITIRKSNHLLFNNLMHLNKNIILQKVNMNETSSFSLTIILPSNKLRDMLLTELPKKGIECRNVVAGNLLRQPVFSKKLKGKFRSDSCKNSDKVHDCGMYLPNHQFIDSKHVEYMVNEINKLVEINLKK